MSALPEADSFTSVPCEISGVTAVLQADNGAGWVITAQARGYGGQVPAAVAFSPEGEILRVIMMPNEETPGLGQKVTEPDFAGQFSGVEGYVESAGSGLVAGINMARYILGKECVDFGDDTMLGAMAHYITSANPESFQPMNANWGIFRSGVNKQDPAKKEKDAAHALERIQEIKKELLNERTD